MAATKGQRIGIWIMAVFMALGSIGAIVILPLAMSNQTSDQDTIKSLTAQYQKETEAWQAKVAAQAAELSKKYFTTFNQFANRPAVFDKASVTELKTEDLLVGDGDAINSESTFTAYYIGWTPDGVVFDSSIDGDSLKAPFSVTPGGVIEGWTKGVDGMKVGGVRELSIPSDLAYGETGSGDKIPPNSPIKFVVMIIPTPEAIPQPEMPAKLMNYYQTGRL